MPVTHSSDPFRTLSYFSSSQKQTEQMQDAPGTAPIKASVEQENTTPSWEGPVSKWLHWGNLLVWPKAMWSYQITELLQEQKHEIINLQKQTLHPEVCDGSDCTPVHQPHLMCSTWLRGGKLRTKGNNSNSTELGKQPNLEQRCLLLILLIWLGRVICIF